MVDTTRRMATPKALALGFRLREARVAAGLNQRDLAAKVGVDHSTVGRYETGERPPKPTKVASILTACGVVGEDHEELVRLSRELDGSHWTSIGLPERRLQLQALLEFERDAECATTVSPLLIPGQLQTDEYARAIMVDAEVPEDEIEERVRIRMGRRELITRNGKSILRALIGESVLRTVIAGPDVMYRQLLLVMQMAEHPAVDVRIIPTVAGWHPGLEGPFLLLEFGDHTLEPDPDSDPSEEDEDRGDRRGRFYQRPIVHIEVRESSLFLHETSNVAAYQKAVHKVLRVAMSPADSVDLIAREAKQFKQQQREGQ
jgi:transcriptional regulator with XRE-family HTH domain